jgi:hypothetical protein
MSTFSGTGTFKRKGAAGATCTVKFRYDTDTLLLDIDSFDLPTAFLPGEYSFTFIEDALEFHFPDVTIHNARFHWLTNPEEGLPPILKTNHEIEVRTPIDWRIPFRARKINVHSTPNA